MVGSRVGMKWTDEVGEALRNITPGRALIIVCPVYFLSSVRGD